MKAINSFIIEKLKLNKQTKIMDEDQKELCKLMYNGIVSMMKDYSHSVSLTFLLMNSFDDLLENNEDGEYLYSSLIKSLKEMNKIDNKICKKIEDKKEIKQVVSAFCQNFLSTICGNYKKNIERIPSFESIYDPLINYLNKYYNK